MSINHSVEEVALRHGISATRAREVASFDLLQWPAADVEAVLNQIHWITKHRDPCGPSFNTFEHWPWWIYPVVSLCVLGGEVLVLPFQIVGLVSLLLRRRFRMIWTELPQPTIAIWHCGQRLVGFLKTPRELVLKSVEEKAALCINKYGNYKIMTGGYAVMSHVWAETMGWNSPKGFGPVELSVRKRGIYLDHFWRFFMRCDAEWLWVDVIAMPEVLEDMSSSEQEEVEKLRVDVINCLHHIYTRADKVIIFDSMALQLQTVSVVDVAVTMACRYWTTRMFTYPEARLAKRALIRTQNGFVDLDDVVDFLLENCKDDKHRYYGLMRHMVWLRPRPGAGPVTMDDIYEGCRHRYTDVNVDQARALFPLLNLKWEVGWTLQQGLAHIKATLPEQTTALKDYCSFRGLELPE